MRAGLFGTRVEEKRWAAKKKDEIIRYWKDKENPRRHFLVQRVEMFSPVSSILEVGCICGPNLYLLAKRFPQARIVGVDINPLAIQLGKELFKKEGLNNVELFAKKADELSEFNDKEFDVILTNALLIYIDPDKIRKVIQELARICEKGFVMAEWHVPEGTQEIYDPHIGVWRRNYETLLIDFFSKKSISISKTPPELWPDEHWKEWGYIIEIIL